MIRRMLIFIGGVTILLAGVCAFSHTWQFGYVGSWGSIGLRNGKLWHVWRVTPIADGEGFYLDDASEVNHAMYSISGGARFREERLWPWLLGVGAVVGYSLVLPAILRLRRRPAPRWLVGALTAACVLVASLWTTSQLATVTFDGPKFHFCLSESAISIFVLRGPASLGYSWRSGPLPPGPPPTPTGIPWGKGWNFCRGLPPLVVDTDGYFSLRGGNLTMKLPLGALFILFVVPTISLLRPDRRSWAGHCKRCAYNLTGNISGVCPECGTSIPIEPR